MTFLVVALVSVLLVWFGFRPLTIPILGDYHVLVDGLVGLTVYGVFSALVLRFSLFLYPLKPGVYSPQDSHATYWRWATVTYHFGLKALSPVTTSINLPLILKLFGAKIGPGVAIGGRIDTPFFVTVGAGAVLGNNTVVSGDVISDGKITLGPVRIGPGSTVGANAVIFPGSEIGAHATVQVGTVVLPGTAIPDGENWRGNPARRWLGDK